jgi:hypothetical protein
VCSVDVGSIGRTTYKLLSCDCVRVASQDPEEELAASNFPTVTSCDGHGLELSTMPHHVMALQNRNYNAEA